jgi:phosphoglycerate dehydrogenase-like enzyme
MKLPVIKITSPSFSKNPILQTEVTRRPFKAVLNTGGHRMEGAALATYLADAEGAIVGLEKVTEEILQNCPKLQIIAKYGVGLDNLDHDACRRHNVAIGWTAGVNRRSVSEMIVGFMIGLGHNVPLTLHLLKQGNWHKEGGIQLSGRTVGIIGLGHIGKDLVGLLRPFGCKILGNDIVDVSEYAQKEGVQLVTKEEIFRTADFITLNVPLTEETRHLINDETLKLFRSDAFLINTSRGKVVDQSALKRALQTGIIAGAAMDVYEDEPPQDLEFLQLPNLICTPHISGNSFEAVVAMGRSAISHLDAFFKVQV